MIISKAINVKILLLKYGKLLLIKEDKLWGLMRGKINTEESLPQALIREAKAACGWQIKNIRLLRINIYEDTAENDMSDKFELVFIVEAVKKTAQATEKQFQPLKWFPLIDLLPKEQVDREDYESIMALNELVLKGKTVELEALPPVFNLLKQRATKVVDLLDLPS